MNRLITAALALACALAASACTPTTSATGWHQIAIGVGTVIGETKTDLKIAAASDTLERYCGALRAVALGASIFAPEKHRAVAAQAAAAVNTLCDAPPRDVASALNAAIKAHDAVLAAGRAAEAPVTSVAGG